MEVQRAGNGRETILLRFVGPKLILPESLIVDTPLDQTWIQVIKDALQIDVAAGSGVYVCNWNYSSSAQGKGWRSELTENVRQFTDRFERNKRQYTVRLVYPRKMMNGNARRKRQATADAGRPSTSQQRQKVPRHGARVRQQTDWQVVQVETDVQASAPLVSNPLGHGHHLVGTLGGFSGKVEEDDDNASLITGITQQNLELRRQGIAIKDVKTGAERRLNQFSNAFLLRCQNEIEKLQGPAWHRAVQRSPLSCYLLQELFKE